MNKKASIIIPCYNVEKTIDKCMASLINQSIGIDALEIILVNDASTDNSYELLCKWEHDYPDSVLLVNCTENGKAGRARNTGLSYASAPYIGFVDDDDICEPGMFETLYNAAYNNGCDLAVCQSVRQNNYTAQDNVAITCQDEIINISGMDERINFLNKDINDAVWNKLYLKDLILENNIFFPENTLYEDIFFSHLMKIYCQKVYISGKVLYHHIISGASVSKNNTPEQRIDFLGISLMLIEEIRSRKIPAEISAWHDEQFIIQYITFIINYEKTFGKLDNEIYTIIKESIKNLYPDILQIPIAGMILKNNSNPGFQEIIRKLL
ncbi:MAG: glycosyltransferase [Lachnospiraceae bacterium]|nr:glycosyltransferase [Lachnospiraceae bacterium]